MMDIIILQDCRRHHLLRRLYNSPYYQIAMMIERLYFLAVIIYLTTQMYSNAIIFKAVLLLLLGTMIKDNAIVKYVGSRPDIVHSRYYFLSSCYLLCSILLGYGAEPFLTNGDTWTKILTICVLVCFSVSSLCLVLLEFYILCVFKPPTIITNDYHLWQYLIRYYSNATLPIIEQRNIDLILSTTNTIDHNTGDKINTTCTICMTEYTDGEKKQKLNCGDCFHKDCISNWIKERRVTCPNCRKNIIEEV